LAIGEVSVVSLYLQARYGSVAWPKLEEEVAKSRKESQP
jgi:hypothetical protein